MRALPDPQGQTSADIGILAAKIGKSADEPGNLQTFAAHPSNAAEKPEIIPAYDALTAGSYGVHYWVQNYGASRAAGSVNIKIEHRKSGSDDPWKYQKPVSRPIRRLAPLQSSEGSVRLPAEKGREYRVSLDVQSLGDMAPYNNMKIFRFIGI